MLKRVHGNNVDFSIIETTSKKVRGNNVDFSSFEITPIKVRENNMIFRPAKLRRKKYAETTTKIFRSSKLHRKKKWKQRGVPVGLMQVFSFFSKYYGTTQ